MAPRVAAGESVGVLFGRERYGLENHEVALADRIVTLPVNPAFASLNLAQAVVIVAYEWFKLASGGALAVRHAAEIGAGDAAAVARLFRQSRTRTRAGRIFPAARQARHHADQPAQHLSPHGADAAGHPDPARRDHGDRRGAQRAGARRRARRRARRKCCARCSPSMRTGQVPNERAPVRGLARLLRRNPTDAERTLWDALTKDRRFAGRGFKRQTPIGRHIADLVSFPLRMVDRSRAGGGERGCGQGARGPARMARRARLSRGPSRGSRC